MADASKEALRLEELARAEAAKEIDEIKAASRARYHDAVKLVLERVKKAM